MATPYETLVFDSTTSTQDEVWARLGSTPLLVVARAQTSGRGRSGAEWANAPRSLAASLGIRPNWPTPSWPLLTLVAGVAALRALGDPARDLTLKWPNDLMRGPLKLGGLLTEASGDRVVAGWGANLFWPDAPEDTGALYDADPGPEVGVEIAERWAEEFLVLVAGEPGGWPHDEYRRRCSTLGREVTWIPDGTGTAVDISPDGGLVVETDTGRRTLTSAAVAELRDHRFSRTAPSRQARVSRAVDTLAETRTTIALGHGVEPSTRCDWPWPD